MKVFDFEYNTETWTLDGTTNQMKRSLTRKVQYGNPQIDTARNFVYLDAKVISNVFSQDV